MKALIVITVDLPQANRIADCLGYIDPPKIPYFDGAVRIVVGEDVDDTIKFLEDPEAVTIVAPRQFTDHQDGYVP